MYEYFRMENSGLAKANRGILYPRRSIFDVVHDRGNLYNSRTNSWRIIRLPFAFRVLLRSSQTSFLPYNSHQYLWLRILTKDSLHPSPQSSSHRIFSHCPSLNMSRIPRSWNILSRGGFWNDVQRPRFRTPLSIVLPAFTIRLWLHFLEKLQFPFEERDRFSL